MPKVITLYACDICGSEYEKEEDAKTCEARGQDVERYQVGDVVVFDQYRFGWYDGERAWIENFDDVVETSHTCETRFCRKCCYRFYYIVTAIDRDPRDGHRVRYHLETKAMKTSTGYSNGYTFNVGHFTPKKVPRPPAAVASSGRALVGRTSKHLLS
jgi:hypothetical protein